jgi:hypothetical protein
MYRQIPICATSPQMNQPRTRVRCAIGSSRLWMLLPRSTSSAGGQSLSTVRPSHSAQLMGTSFADADRGPLAKCRSRAVAPRYRAHMPIRIGEPSPRTGRLLCGESEFIIPDEAMALTWSTRPTLWRVVNERLGTLIDEHEEETLAPEQVVAAAQIIREAFADAVGTDAAVMRDAADFLESNGRAGRDTTVAL